MRIEVRNLKRQWLFTAEVDLQRPPAVVRPPNAQEPRVHLRWDQCLDDGKRLRCCPVCECGELFVRKDFPQLLGLLIVLTSGIGAVLLFALNRPMWAYLLLGGMAVVDAGIYLLAGRCLVCYRCRSEFRGVEIPDGQLGWNLATGEKYRAGEA